jgi:hypothetical protein
VRLSPELEAAVLARATKVTTVNAAVLGPAPLDMSPPPAGCSEKDFQARVVKLALGLGWERVFHVFDSRRSEPGFMDTVFGCEWRSTPVLVAELKVPPNKPTAEQLWWLRVFEKAGIPTYVWYPDQWQEIVAALRRP